MLQTSFLQNTLVVRGRLDATTAGRALANEVRAIDPELPIYGIRPLEDVVAASLGATPRELARLVLRRGATLTALGVTLGLIGAAGLSGWIRGLLYQRSALDASTYLAAATVLALVALLACGLPARRAAAIDPVKTLRGDG